ncbi:capsid cement protein [Cellulosimicrobium cellulans]|uniref:capsid cement protein n=1 Tax=Cellulosimicrobium cellulans TaxID=1710 RepID=UPI00380E3157
MGDYVPLFEGNARTFTADADVTGGQLVIVTGDRAVSTATADSAAVVGVAAFDAKDGDDVTVHGGGVQRLIAAGAITAGARVAAAAGGKVSVTGENTIGLALTAAADGAEAQIRLDA